MSNPREIQIHEWCEESADLTEQWAREAKEHDLELCVLLNDVCDACDEIVDLLVGRKANNG